LPELYLALLRITDGFWCNGGTIYSSYEGSRRVCWSVDPDESEERTWSGVVEESVELRTLNSEFRSMVVFGGSDLDYFVWRPPEEEYQMLSHGSDTVWERFGTLEELLRKRLPPVLMALVSSTM
jgi:hypothetical protein